MRSPGVGRQSFADARVYGAHVGRTRFRNTPDQTRLSDLPMPALVIWGALDFPFVIQRCRRLVDAVPFAKGVEIPGTAHLPNLEQPEQVNDLLWDFLSAG